jgi:hypothetical protein
MPWFSWWGAAVRTGIKADVKNNLALLQGARDVVFLDELPRNAT